MFFKKSEIEIDRKSEKSVNGPEDYGNGGQSCVPDEGNEVDSFAIHDGSGGSQEKQKKSQDTSVHYCRFPQD